MSDSENENPNQGDSSQSAEEISRQEALKKLSEMIVRNDTAMLVTTDASGVSRSCPMVNINENFDGDIYFLSEKGDEVVRRLASNENASVVIAEVSRGCYANITGTAEVSTDRKKAELLWNDKCRRYYGTSTPGEDVVVIRIDVVDAEYWDCSESFSRQVVRWVKRLTGGDSEALDVEHEKVDWVAEEFEKETIGS